MTWIMTRSGRHFDLLNPRSTEIKIDDIATGLSNICRFTGQLPCFYSVAQHCVMASHIVHERFSLEALLHDAQEAYVGDMSTPLKSMLPGYKEIEDKIESVIRSMFGLPSKQSPEVKQADLKMLATERRFFGLDDGTKWPILDGIVPLDVVIDAMTPEQAKKEFLKRFVELT